MHAFLAYGVVHLVVPPVLLMVVPPIMYPSTVPVHLVGFLFY